MSRVGVIPKEGLTGYTDYLNLFFEKKIDFFFFFNFFFQVGVIPKEGWTGLRTLVHGVEDCKM